jgi:hypothetical protein
VRATRPAERRGSKSQAHPSPPDSLPLSGEYDSHDPPKDTGTADLCLGALLFHARVY